MTPSEKLDIILKSGKIPKIADVVDVAKYKYVWRNHGGIACGNYKIAMVYGLMSDGASCVPDRVPDAFFAHDRLYVSPFAYYKGVHKEISKRKCDLIYARLGLKHHSYIVFFEGLILATGINKRVWKNYRKQDQARLIEERTVPHAVCWEFPTQFTKDAYWIG